MGTQYGVPISFFRMYDTANILEVINYLKPTPYVTVKVRRCFAPNKGIQSNTAIHTHLCTSPTPACQYLYPVNDRSFSGKASKTLSTTCPIQIETGTIRSSPPDTSCLSFDCISTACVTIKYIVIRDFNMDTEQAQSSTQFRDMICLKTTNSKTLDLTMLLTV